MRVSHRYLVMRRGEIVQELGRTATREELMVAATGGNEGARLGDNKSAVEAAEGHARLDIPALISRLGFWTVLIFTGLFFSLTARHFATFDNLFAMLHTMAPIAAISSGMALLAVGQVNISVGSVAFLSTTLGVLGVVRMGWPIWLGVVISFGSAAIFGALNGLIVVVLRVIR